MTTTTQTATTTTWNLDLSHSEIGFKVKHLMISTVTGQFRNFEVKAVTTGDDFSQLVGVDVAIDVQSIDTRNEQRDGHLRSADFFKADQFPKILFTSTRFEDDKLYGRLTIQDHTKDIVLQVETGGIVQDPYKQTKAGFTVTGTISRKEFGLTWNAVTEAGSIVVGDDIKFHAEIQLVKQA